MAAEGMPRKISKTDRLSGVFRAGAPRASVGPVSWVDSPSCKASSVSRSISSSLSSKP